jgi:penicillin-insensitive murein endopeptidase
LRTGLIAGALALAVFSAAAAVAAVDKTPAKFLFGHVSTPTGETTRSIGSYARGCLAGAEPLPLDGPHWQVMRLSRNRNWGTPELLGYIEKFSQDVATKDGWNGLLIGDMSQPRGGPMPTGHASHQIGLDADIWFVPMPTRVLSKSERETISAVSMLMTGRLTVDPAKWSDLYPRLLKRAVSYPEVARIFVSPAIKQRLCDGAGADSAWLRKLRPWWGHDDHFHVRLQCPPGMAGCDAQTPPPPGDGCGADLASWFKPHLPPKIPRKPAPELTLADLPSACGDVLAAPGAAMVAEPANAAPAPPMPLLRSKAN